MLPEIAIRVPGRNRLLNSLRATRLSTPENGTKAPVFRVASITSGARSSTTLDHIDHEVLMMCTSSDLG